MKRLRITPLAMLCAFALAGAHAWADTPSPGDRAQWRERHGWCGWPATGNVDQDFALRMRRHHQMGIEMARDELARGTDPALRAHAQAMVDGDPAAVAQLEAWLTARHVDYAAMPMGRRHYVLRFDAVDLNHDGILDATEVNATHPWHGEFVQADANHDGRVSRAEADAFLGMGRMRFDDADTNGDGFLDATEVPNTHVFYPRFAAADANHDGRVSRAEMDAWRPGPPRFEDYDANGDGTVTRAEMDAWHAAHPMPRWGDRDRDHDGDVDRDDCVGRPPPDGDAHSAPMPPDFAGMDKNGDGYLTADELPQSDWVRDHFTAFDANGDGRISDAEFAAHHAMMDSMRH